MRVRVGWALYAIEATQQVENCEPQEKTVHRDRGMRFRDLEENVDLDKEGTVTSSSPGPRQRANDQGRFAPMQSGSYE